MKRENAFLSSPQLHFQCQRWVKSLTQIKILNISNVCFSLIDEFLSAFCESVFFSVYGLINEIVPVLRVNAIESIVSIKRQMPNLIVPKHPNCLLKWACVLERGYLLPMLNSKYQGGDISTSIKEAIQFFKIIINEQKEYIVYNMKWYFPVLTLQSHHKCDHCSLYFRIPRKINKNVVSVCWSFNRKYKIFYFFLRIFHSNQQRSHLWCDRSIKTGKYLWNFKRRIETMLN